MLWIPVIESDKNLGVQMVGNPRRAARKVHDRVRSRVVDYPLGVCDVQNVATVPRDAIRNPDGHPSEPLRLIELGSCNRYIHIEFSYALWSCNGAIVAFMHEFIHNSDMLFNCQALRSARRSQHHGKVLDCLAGKVAFCVCIVLHLRTMTPVTRWPVRNVAVHFLQPKFSTRKKSTANLKGIPQQIAQDCVWKRFGHPPRS